MSVFYTHIYVLIYIQNTHGCCFYKFTEHRRMPSATFLFAYIFIGKYVLFYQSIYALAAIANRLFSTLLRARTRERNLLKFFLQTAAQPTPYNNCN